MAKFHFAVKFLSHFINGGKFRSVKIENVSGETNKRGLSELRLKSEYRSDQDDFVSDFYVPCLARSLQYWRAAGYFTSRGLAVAAQGITALIKAGGKMRLVVSPLFTAEDLDAIQRGYAARLDVVTKSLLRGFETIPNKAVEDRLGYPQSPNRLLAPVQNFCESERMSAMLGFTGLPVAYGGILFHAITVAQLVAQVKPQALVKLSNHCKIKVAGVAKWQTHRT